MKKGGVRDEDTKGLFLSHRLNLTGLGVLHLDITFEFALDFQPEVHQFNEWGHAYFVVPSPIFFFLTI
jgi:hypothetical protein